MCVQYDRKHSDAYRKGGFKVWGPALQLVNFHISLCKVFARVSFNVHLT